LSSAALAQVINHPTRITASSQTLLDPIIVSEELLSGTSSNVIPMPHISDHDMVSGEIIMPNYKVTPTIRQYRDFKNINHPQFYSDLQTIPWRNIFELHTVGEKVF